MRKSNRPFIPSNDYSEFHFIRRLVFGNSLTKYNKLTSFSYSEVIFSLQFPHIPPCFHAKSPDCPRLFEAHEYHELIDITNSYARTSHSRLCQPFDGGLFSPRAHCGNGSMQESHSTATSHDFHDVDIHWLKVSPSNS